VSIIEVQLICMTIVKNLLNKAVYGALALMMAMTLFAGVAGSAADLTGSVCTSGSVDVCLGTESTGNETASSQQQIVNLILNIVTWVVYIVGAVAVVFLVYGGILFIVNPGGNEDNVKKGKTIIFNALIGLVIVLLATTIITLVQNAIGGLE
jgi:hypothetical protein